MSNGSSRIAPDHGAQQDYPRPPPSAISTRTLDANALRARASAHIAAHPPKPATPPPDPGQILTSIPRPDGSELRACLQFYNEHPFVRLALWRDGWPVKGSGCTVRMRELGAVVAALCDAMDLEGEAQR